MKNTTSETQMQLLLDAYACFGLAPFTRREFIKEFGDTQASNSFLGNGKAKGWMNCEGSRGSMSYYLTRDAHKLVVKATEPKKPAVLPLPDPINAKSPEAILRQVRRRLEDQIDLIDEALENINRSDTDAAKFRAIEKLVKG